MTYDTYPVLSNEGARDAAGKLVDTGKLIDELHNQFTSSCLTLIDDAFDAAITLFARHTSNPSLQNQTLHNPDALNYKQLTNELNNVRLTVSTDFICALGDHLLAWRSDQVKQSLLWQDSAEDANTEQPSRYYAHLAIELTKKRMVTHARQHSIDELHALKTRLSDMFPDADVTPDNCPLDPKFLTDTFVTQCEKKLLSALPGRLKFYRVIENVFLCALKAEYAAANRYLQSHGVLPKLNTENTLPSHVSGPRVSHSPGNRQQSTKATVHTLFAPSPKNLDLLLDAPSRSSDRNLIPVDNKKHGAEMSTAALIAAVHAHQQAIDEALTEAEPENILPHVINQALKAKHASLNCSISKVDQGVINLVAIFFDELLTESNIPLAVQSFLCRLQIPVIKIALNDHPFFCEPEHPTRIFINTLIELGTPFHDAHALHKDPLYQCMNDCVRKVVEAPDYSGDHYLALTNALIDTQARCEIRRNNIEKRTQLTEAGIARLQRAKADAHQVVLAACERSSLTSLNDFFESDWKQVLVITHLKQGKRSADWEHYRTLTIKAAIFLSAIAQKGFNNTTLNTPEVKKLLRALAEGLKNSAANTETCDEIILSLVKKIARESKNGVDARTSPNMPHASKQAQNSADALSNLKQNILQQKQVADQYLLAAKSLSTDTWVSYTLEPHTAPRACKLSRKFDDNMYLFTNRMGAKVACKLIEEVAHDLLNGDLVVLEKCSSFDRLMKNALTKLGAPA